MENNTFGKCPKCGRSVDPAANYCANCSAPLKPEFRKSGYEWKSRKTVLGYPLVHIAFGKNEHGKLRVAKGIVAIGQFGLGVFTFAQVGVGILFGFGQCILGLTALAQFAFAPLIAVGQIAVAYAAVGQVVVAVYGVGQVGWAVHLWSSRIKDPEALHFFRTLWEQVRSFFV